MEKGIRFRLSVYRREEEAILQNMSAELLMTPSYIIHQAEKLDKLGIKIQEIEAILL